MRVSATHGTNLWLKAKSEIWDVNSGDIDQQGVEIQLLFDESPAV